MLTEEEVELVNNLEKDLKEVEGDFAEHANLAMWAVDKLLPILKRYIPKDSK